MVILVKVPPQDTRTEPFFRFLADCVGEVWTILII